MQPTSQDKFLNPRTIAVLLFTVAYTVAAIGGAFSRDNSEFLIYIGVMVILLGIVGFVHYRVRLHIATLWAMSIWGLLHMAGGLVPVPESWPINGDIRVLYSWWIIPDRLKYDQVVHAYGFGVTTWVCWQAIRAAVRPYGNLRPTFGVMTLCAVAGMGFGAANEIVEFVATLLVENTNVGDYTNTGWDLVSNAIGAITAAVLIAVMTKPSPAALQLRVERP